MEDAPAVARLERPAAAVGLAAAAVVTLGGALPWIGEPLLGGTSLGSPAAVALGLVAAAVFVVRRRDLVAATPAAVLAGAVGFATVALVLVRLVRPAMDGGPVPPIGPGLAVAALGGLLVVGMAAAVRRDVGSRALLAMTRRIAVGFALIVAGFVVMFIVASLIVSAVPGDDARTRVLANVVTGVAEVAFVLVGVVFLRATDRPLGYVRAAVPDLRDVGYVVAGLVGLVAIQIAFGLLITSFGVPSSSSGLNRVAETAAELGTPGLYLLYVPVMLFVVGPAEEFLFRGVIQRYLYGVFGRTSAVVVASVVFAIAHVFAYWSANTAGLVVSLSVIFVLSLVLGFIYERTDNLTVTAVIHGVFNALLVVLTYVAIVAGEFAMVLP